MNCLTFEIDEESSNLLELAANNDVEAFRRSVEHDPSAVDKVGFWYGRKKGSNRMVLEHRTPLMVASTYGSLDVLKFIVSLPSVDINQASGPDRTTALHCAASGGSFDAVDAVKILLAACADPNLFDANGNRAANVAVAPPKLPDVKFTLEHLLGGNSNGTDEVDHPHPLCVMTTSSNSDSPPLSFSPDEDGSPLSNSTSSPPMVKFRDLPRFAVSEKKEYPVDPSLPDIKNSIYATDEFRIFSFKIRPCSRAYSHDWTECPFVHPGENARRRDPRKYHYSCVPCPDFRKGACRRGDMCEYAHGVFECWLHPAQYRTRLCKDGTSCSRRVCFFAHTNEELRPLYMSTGSAVPSPRSSSSATLEMAAALGLVPGSPSSVSAIMPPFIPPMPLLSNGTGHSTLGWQQPNVPTLNLPASNIQSSRLRSSLSARDMPLEDLSEFDTQQLLNDASYSVLGSLTGNNSVRNKTLTPSNLDEIFSSEIALSPRYNSDQGAIFSPSHRTAILNQLQQQQQQHSLLSPIKTSLFSPTAADTQHLSAHSSLLQASRTISSPSLMSPRSVESVSPMSSRVALLSQQERQQTLRSLSSRDLSPILSPNICSPVSSSWSKWASPSGAADWGVNGEELGGLRRSSSFEMHGNGDEPDLSWVHSLVKESSPEKLTCAAMSPSTSGLSTIFGECSNSNSQMEGHDQTAVLGAWLEQMQLDQVLTQGEKS